MEKELEGIIENMNDEILSDFSSIKLNNSIKRKNCGIYTRISSSKQVNGTSLEIQSRKCLNFANQKGLNVKEIYSEIGSAYQGSNLLTKFDEFCQLYKNSTVLIYSVDRFSRSVEKGMNFLEKMLKQNTRLIFVEDGIVFDRKTSKKVNPQIKKLLELAENESRTLGRRISKSKQFNIEKGLYTGGRIKYGYQTRKYQRGNKIYQKYVKNKYEQNVIKFIILCRTKNTSANQINKILKYLYKGNDYEDLTLYYGDKETEKLQSSLSFTNIAEILNDYGILRRGRKWNVCNVSLLFKRYNKNLATLLRNLKI